MTLEKVLGEIVGQDQVRTEPHVLDRCASDGSFSAAHLSPRPWSCHIQRTKFNGL